MNVDTPTPIDLFLTELENQRATKCPWVLGVEVTHCRVEAIKKIGEWELPRLEAMVRKPFTSRQDHGHTTALKPLEAPLPAFRETWMEMKL